MVATAIDTSSLTCPHLEDHDYPCHSRQSSQIEYTVQSFTPQVLPNGPFPPWIGQKFLPDGTVLSFPGNTTICHLPDPCSLRQALHAFLDDLQRQAFADCFVVLPPSSWHMTVCEGVAWQIRKKSSWPLQLPFDISLAECNDFIAKRLGGFDLQSEMPFQMKIQGWEPLKNGIALKVVPADDQEEKRLRGLRNRLAEASQMYHPDHEKYSFHISITYTLRYLTLDEMKTVMAFLEDWLPKLPTVFDLGAPEYCVFDNMFAFHRQFYLKKQQ